MSADYSAWRFASFADVEAVLMQQGRVQLDSDWNEAMAALLRRMQADSVDTLGPAVVCKETPAAFEIAVDGASLTIGPGRMYVDGLLVDNHGGGEPEWDPVLEEMRGTKPLAWTEQIYQPDAPPVPAGGPHLVYLKAWRREITAIEQPGLIERAVGVDTTARRQLAWQVKVLADVGAGVTCATPLEDIPAFLDAEPPAAARLSTDTTDVPPDEDPCHIPPAGGYRGLENQLYRVEIHQGGGVGAATFKWSRDNATVASRVTAIPQTDRIVVESVGRDDVLAFADGDWIEITDDHREYAGLPGELRRIRSGGGVDESTRTIFLTSALPAGAFPVDGQGNIDPSRNTRVRRWDQHGSVTDADDNQVVDLDQPAATGAIPVPAAGTQVRLEHGIVVSFDLVENGRFRTGDHWVFAARTADATIDVLDQAPPLGLHAHYAKLALVTFPKATDCREHWPPEFETGCDCTACVSPQSHEDGTLTIQAALDKVQETGGTVCLAPGVYRVQKPLLIAGAKSVRLRGQGWRSMLVASEGGDVLAVRNSEGVAIENLSMVATPRDAAGSAVTVENAIGVSLENCSVQALAARERDGVGAALALRGVVLGLDVRRCELVAGAGIVGGLTGEEGDYAAVGSVRVEDNLLRCRDHGVRLDRFTTHVAETRIRGNAVHGCRVAGIAAVGGATEAATIDVVENTVETAGDGIVIGCGSVRVRENDLVGTPEGEIGNGIVLDHGIDPAGMRDAQILANRVSRFRGHGIAIRTALQSGMIKDNRLADLGGGGIVMEGDGDVGRLDVENNQLSDVVQRSRRAGHVAAMRFLGVRQLAITTNTIDGFALEAVDARACTAIHVIASGVTRIGGNILRGIGPAQAAGETTAIEVAYPTASTRLNDNAVQRQREPADELAPTQWRGLRVLGGMVDEKLVNPIVADGVVALVSRIGFAGPVPGGALLTTKRLRALPLAPTPVDLSANAIVAETTTIGLIQVRGASVCSMTASRITTLGSVSSEPSLLEADRLIVGDNLVTAHGDRDVLVLEVHRKDNWTVLGNMTTSRIILNTDLLPSPWLELNRIVG